MGMRNPFRYAVNRTNGDVYLGDYSPDAQEADPERGPEGTGRWMLIRRRGQLRLAVLHHARPAIRRLRLHARRGAVRRGVQLQRADQRLGQQHRLAPAAAGGWPEVWYSYNTGQDLFPELFNPASNGIGPMGGPAMQFDADISSPFRWPRVFSGHPLFYEWTRDYAKVFELNRRNGGRLADIHHFLGAGEGGTPNIVLDNPMDMEFGPDNALYELEYGTGYFAELPAAQLARIDYVRNGQYTPVVRGTATPASGTTAPLTVQFSSAGTTDANDDRLSYAWDFTPTARWTRAMPTRHTRTRRGASTRPRCA